ncbi:SGNH/GDSL hydrolase family protein, partial [Tessaracoccus lubricantis]
AGALVSAGTASYLKGRRDIMRHVADYGVHWGERVDGGAGALRYVALGDSAAQGVGATHVSRGYVPRIGAKLAEATGREVIITNLSVSGATSADVVRDQLPLFRDLPFTPDLVTLDIGGNDVVFPGHTPSSFEANMDVILEALPTGAFIADVPWFMVPVLGRQSQQMAGRASILIEQHHHHLVPLHRGTREAGFWRYHRYTAGDWFHPNDLGYEEWAEAFWAVIEASGVVETLRAPDGGVSEG